MNIFQKILYVISCDVIPFLVLLLYNFYRYGIFSWIILFALLISILISLFQIPIMKRKLEVIGVELEEMDLNGINVTDVFMTLVSYLFILAAFVPSGQINGATETLCALISMMIQLLLCLISDRIPYNVFYIIRGYAYRNIKIDGIAQVLLCKRKIRNRKTIKVVSNPFRGLLFHIDQHNG